MARETVYLESKPRYEILDGLRGVAALMVVLFHIFETYSKGPAYQIVNHGYLAVDFFFVLSGFVIGYAYDDRWDKMTTWGFFKRRLTRLHPMVIMGTLVGAALFFFSGTAFPQTLQTPGWKFALCILMGLLLIPCGNGLDIRGWGEMNSLNGPSWTLTFEYIGNILYAFILRHLPKVVLAILCVVCAFFTLDLTMGWNVFGLLPKAQYNVIGGWSLAPDQIYIGFTRLLYPFLCGLLISRILPSHRSDSNPSGSPIHLKGGFWWCSLAIVVILAIPCIGGKQGVADGLYQALSILILFPLIVLTGAGSKTTDAKSTAVCKWLGEISYPIYITHYPLMYMQMDWVAAHADAPLWQHIVVAAGIFFLSIVLAYGLLKVYDEPVREWLKNHWLKSRSMLSHKGAMLLAVSVVFLSTSCQRPGDWTQRERAVIADQPAVMRVLTVDDPEDLAVLRTICNDLSTRSLKDPLYAELSAKMLATVTSPEQDGVGIAGPQVGISRRIVAVQRFDKDGEPFEVYPNIRITAFRGDLQPGPEGCLSVPGRRGEVLRYRDIDICYCLPESGRDTTERVEGFTAVIFQHEVDHLDGVLYIDKLN